MRRPAASVKTTTITMNTIEIGSTWQLFLDDFLIEQMSGLSRVLHPPRKCGVVLEGDEPWESAGVHVHPDNGVFRDDDRGKWHMLYRAMTWEPQLARTLEHNPGDRAHHFRARPAYAWSDDGMRWHKPKLGLADAPAELVPDHPLPRATGATRQNNCGAPILHCLDLSEHGNVRHEDRRYLMRVAADPGQAASEERFFFARRFPDFSGNPNWRHELEALPKEVQFPPRGWKYISGYDAGAGEWISFMQTHWNPCRSIARWASKDLISWTGSNAMSPDSLDPHSPERFDELMDASVVRCEDLWLAFVVVFHGDRTDRRFLAPGLTGAWRKGTCELQLACSRDAGQTWTRIGNRRPWLPHGDEEDSLDRLVFPTKPMRIGDEDWFYYLGYDGDHLLFLDDAAQSTYYHDRVRVGRVMLARQRRHGYVSLSCGPSAHTLVTKPLMLAGGSTLYVNADATRGSIRAEVVLAQHGPTTDPGGLWIEAVDGFGAGDCRPIAGGGAAQAVRWAQDRSLASVREKPVRLRFQIANADLYGFCVR